MSSTITTELTERDECTYHEMMVHLPLFSHQNPRTVLIVGGGDGVLLREVLRHKEVQKVTLVEIDPIVIHVSKNHLKLVPAELYEDPRVEVVHADAAKYLEEDSNRSKYDIILTDTLDPLGPAESLFEPEFYEAMYLALREDGIVCARGDNLWIHFNLIADLIQCCADIFDCAEYATTCVPSHPCGQIGFVLARKGQTKSCSSPVRLPRFQKDLQWYNPQMHRAAFALPEYAKKKLEAVNRWNQLEDDEDEDEKCLFAECTIQ
jgi:spermidine synthase